jgi:hypothetical protein
MDMGKKKLKAEKGEKSDIRCGVRGRKQNQRPEPMRLVGDRLRELRVES